MNPISVIAFMVFVLPALLIKEAYRMLVKFMTKHKLWWPLLYLITFGLVVLFIMLWVKGYRI